MTGIRSSSETTVAPPRAWGYDVTSQRARRHDGSPPRARGNPWAGQCSEDTHGSPPRVWGNRSDQPGTRTVRRFTPTCVGKSAAARPSSAALLVSPPRVWVNPRPPRLAPVPIAGSPPRVWGNRRGRRFVRVNYRFTPTCVGKSSSMIQLLRQFGSPPRVWGNRSARRGPGGPGPVHPHVCGEICSTRIARSGTARFTPTCVGKSYTASVSATTSPVHPHVCGEIVRQ